MKLELIKRNGMLCGIAILEEREKVMIAREGELWRICESCCEREALAFCRTHVKYVCGDCIAKAPAVHLNCQFISIAVARDLARTAQQYQEVEA